MLFNLIEAEEECHICRGTPLTPLPSLTVFLINFYLRFNLIAQVLLLRGGYDEMKFQPMRAD